MSAASHQPKQADMSSLSESELVTLRKLLMGPEYEKLLKHRITLENPELLTKHISPVISEALKLRATEDLSLQETLNPIVTRALLDSVSKDPKPIADALYPIMGPAIRKSINTTMNQMLSNFNELLEQSMSPKAWRWLFDAWRTGRSYSEVVLLNTLVFQVEQVFLIHRESGLLLQHVVADTAISKDPDMISGMLTAIQDFTRDSFSIDENSGLNSLNMGDLTLLVEQGPSAVISAVVRGPVPQEMQTLLTTTLEQIHQQNSHHLSNYNGDQSSFDHTYPLLSKCLRIKRKTDTGHPDEENKKSFKALWIVIPTLILGYVYMSYLDSQELKAWTTLVNRINSEPGLIITDASDDGENYKISGLADPLASPPEYILKSENSAQLDIKLDFKPYASLEPELVLQRIRQALLAPKSVNLTLKNDVLYATGYAQYEWIKQFRLSAPLFAGIKTVNLNQLQQK